jgi:hypothetical protein
MGKAWEGGRAQKNMRGTGVRDMRGGTSNEKGRVGGHNRGKRLSGVECTG